MRRIVPEMVWEREIPVRVRRVVRKAVREKPVAVRRVVRKAVREKPVSWRSLDRGEDGCSSLLFETEEWRMELIAIGRRWWHVPSVLEEINGLDNAVDDADKNEDGLGLGD
mmetsp:Transcript_34671/g.58883  ORF Transcript_34671/g.58883 Transcript_34671/m.58883 type:complete len:111 (+) Transcript_34671:921-1253(+)